MNVLCYLLQCCGVRLEDPDLLQTSGMSFAATRKKREQMFVQCGTLTIAPQCEMSQEPAAGHYDRE